MKVKRNTYRTKGKWTKLNTKAVVKRPGGVVEEVYVRFSGGGFKPDRTPGQFTTQDQDLIAALEKHGENGKLFELVNSVQVDADKGDFVESAVRAEEVLKDVSIAPKAEEAEGVPEEEPEATEEIGPDMVTVESITKVQDAKQYLIDNFGVSVNSVRNKEFVIQVAKENHIVFPNLQ